MMQPVPHVQLLENFPDAAMLVDKQAKVLFSNGRPPVFEDALPAELQEMVRRFSQRKGTSEERLLALNGSGQTLEVRLGRIDQGKADLLLVCVRDVTTDVQLEEKMLQRSEELSILYEITALETERLSMDTIVIQVAAKLLELTALESWHFFELLDDQWRLRSALEYDEKKQPAWLKKALADRELMQLLGRERSAIWRQLPAPPSAVLRMLKAAKLGILVTVPITVRSELKGFVLLSARDATPARVHDNTRFFDLISRQLGSALERAELFYALEESFREIDNKNRQLAGQLKLAQKLQSGILEIQFPQRPEIEFAVKYIPSYHLGGDFYDVFELPQKRVGVLIADVCGHGVSSALITTFLKAAAKDLSQNLEDAAQLLNRLNQKLIPVLPLGMFVSAFYLVIDTEGHELHFSNGGHPLPLFFDAKSDTVVELEVEGRLLSVTQDSVYQTRTVGYASGDKVFLFTDGLYEIENSSGEYLGDQEVRRIIFENRTLPARMIVEKLMETVYSFAGTQELNDDVNVIGIDLIA